MPKYAIARKPKRTPALPKKGTYTGKIKLVRGRIVQGSIKFKGPGRVRIKPAPPEVMRPGEKQVAEMIRIIESEPMLVGGTVLCKSAGHCAMGALLFSLGLDIKNKGDTANEWPIEYLTKLYDYFRIDANDCGKIITANDSVENAECIIVKDEEYDVLPTQKQVSKRRKEVINAIKEIGRDPRPRMRLEKNIDRGSEWLTTAQARSLFSTRYEYSSSSSYNF